MTDHDELRRLAEIARDAESGDYIAECRDFERETTPDAVLELLDKIDRLRRERDEALAKVEMVRGLGCESCGGSGVSHTNYYSSEPCAHCDGTGLRVPELESGHD